MFLRNHAPLQRQKAVSAHLKSKQILSFGSGELHGTNTVDNNMILRRGGGGVSPSDAIVIKAIDHVCMFLVLVVP